MIYNILYLFIIFKNIIFQRASCVIFIKDIDLSIIMVRQILILSWFFLSKKALLPKKAPLLPSILKKKFLIREKKGPRGLKIIIATFNN